jgi:hypothetical protein
MLSTEPDAQVVVSGPTPGGEALDLDTTFVSPARAGLRRRLLRALLLGPILAGLGPLVEPMVGGTIAAASLVVAVAWMFVTALLADRLRRGERGRVHVEASGIHLGDQHLARAHLGSALYVPAATGRHAYVALRDHRDRSAGQFDVPSPDVAEHVLALLSFGTADAAATLSGVAPPQTRAGTGAWFALVGGLLIFAVSTWWNVTAVGVLGILLAVFGPVALLPARFTVGADGVRVRTRLDVRFVPWAQVEKVAAESRGAMLHLHGGEQLSLPVTARRAVAHPHEKEASAALLARCSDALRAFRDGAPVDAAALLARGGRPLGVWRRALFDQAGDFCRAALDEERLWAVLESFTSAPTARAGAAAVLGRGAESGSRERLRIAAEACAEPALSRVIGAAAAGDEEQAIDEALAAVEDPMQTRAGSLRMERSK